MRFHALDECKAPETFTGDPRDWPIGTYRDLKGENLVLVVKAPHTSCGSAGMQAIQISGWACTSPTLLNRTYVAIEGGTEIRITV